MAQKSYNRGASSTTLSDNVRRVGAGHFRTPKERSRFAARVHHILDPGGLWHSLIGSTDGPSHDTGPPRQSAHDVVAAVESRFEIFEPRSAAFDQDQHRHARAWVPLGRRRQSER